MFKNLSPILSHRPLGSLVFSRKGITGVAFFEGKEYEIGAIKVRGSTLTDMLPLRFNHHIDHIDKGFDRQVSAIGGLLQSQLQKTKISIVGVGGTGSSMAVQLARMGVGEIVLIDMDELDPSNMPRV